MVTTAIGGCLGSVEALEACINGYLMQPGWRPTVEVFVGFTVVNTIIGFALAWLLDCWWIPLCVRRGWATRTTERKIQLSTAELVWENISGINAPSIFATIVGVGIMRNIGIRLAIYPLRLLWVTTFFMMWYDTWYFILHRISHRVKWFYRHVHADHHKISVMLEARTGVIASFVEGALFVGVPYCSLVPAYVWWFGSPDLLMCVQVLVVASHVGLMNHTGVEFHNVWAWLASGPLSAATFLPGTAQWPIDHQLHHEIPNKNFGVIYNHWDDWAGTAAERPKRFPASPLLMAWNLASYGAATWLLQQLPSLSATAWLQVAAAMLLHVVTPLPTPSSWLRRAGFLDVLRKAYGSSTEVSAPLKPNQRYIFCYHSQAAVPPGFWWTFAAQDSASPVAAAGIRVRAAVNSTLLQTPFVRHIVALFGGISPSKSSLQCVLASKGSGESVAVCVRSTAPQKGVGELSADLASLVTLAVETGAILVPVVASGEEEVSTTLWEALVVPAQRRNIKVTVGSPVELPTQRVTECKDSKGKQDQNKHDTETSSVVGQVGAAYLTALQQLQQQVQQPPSELELRFAKKYVK